MQVLTKFSADGDESLAMHAILGGEEGVMLPLSRREELCLAWGYYLGRKQDDRAAHILTYLKETK